MSSEQVLLSADAAGDWTRVGPNQMLIPQQLLVLPTYRAKVALTVGVTLEILGPARVELLGSSRQALPGIRVLYGRVVLMPLGKAGARLQVAFGDHSGTITFADADSIAALDVRRLRAPGTNPESGPSRIAADLYVTTGGISWEETVDGKGGEPLQLAPLQRLSFDAQVDLAAKGRQGVAQVDHGRADQVVGSQGVGGDRAGVADRPAGPRGPAGVGHLAAAEGGEMAGAALSGLCRPVPRHGGGAE